MAQKNIFFRGGIEKEEGKYLVKENIWFTPELELFEVDDVGDDGDI